MKKVTISDFLISTNLINFNHTEIVRMAKSITRGLNLEADKARAIFYFVRDQISYVFRAEFHEEAYQASSVLGRGMGFCTQKAILFCALARCCGFPAGLYFYDIIDFTLPDYIVNLLKTCKLYFHGITALYMGGEWYQYDATLNQDLVQKKSLRPVEFCKNNNCLMHSKTIDGKKHIEYINDHGLYSDVNIHQIQQWLSQCYPHLYQEYATSMNDFDIDHYKPT